MASPLRVVRFAVWAVAASFASTVDAQTLVRLDDPSGSEAGRRAAVLCSEAAVMPPGTTALDRLGQALALAEVALLANPLDAKANFAVFCSIGRRVEIEGVGLFGLKSLPRLRQAIEYALESEPNFLEALIAKGMLLVRLPWLLGGDSDEGSELIHRAVALDSNSVEAHLALGQALADQGETALAARATGQARALAARRSRMVVVPLQVAAKQG